MNYTFIHAGELIGPPAGFIGELRAIIPPGAKNFLEWGAGCSTLLFQEIARERDGFVVSIDDSQVYAASISKELEIDRVNLLCADLQGGYEDKATNYGTLPMALNFKPDFILIDGRRRVECAVTAKLISGPDTVIALHDYRRTRYLAMPHILTVTQDGPHFRVMKK